MAIQLLIQISKWYLMRYPWIWETGTNTFYSKCPHTPAEKVQNNLKIVSEFEMLFGMHQVSLDCMIGFYQFRYNGATGVFVVPHSLGGLYFFSMHLVTEDKKYARFVIYRNTEILCGSYADNRESPGGNDAISCSVIAKLSSGKDDWNKCLITQFLFIFCTSKAR